METDITLTGRRKFLNPLAWLALGASTNAPSLAQPAEPASTPAHEDGEMETQLINGSVASFLHWPTYKMVNQHAEQVDFYQDVISGHAVVISFFYTKCKGSCPVTMGRMLELRNLLTQQERLVRFISISLEPEIDTASVLKQYAEDVLPSASDWHLLTGDPGTIKTLRTQLGFYDLNPRVDADPRRHAAMVLMGDDRTHRWTSLPAVSTLRQWRSAIARCMS